MPHLHELIDFVVVVWIVYKNKVLLIHHKKLNKWLPLGGHIELNEDPEQALFREIKEESGLEVEIIAEKPRFEDRGRKFLYVPTFLDIHDISPTHKHIGMNYFAKAKSDKVKLNKDEHHKIRWFTEDELDKPDFNLQKDVKYCAREALWQLRYS